MMLDNKIKMKKAQSSRQVELLPLGNMDSSYAMIGREYSMCGSIIYSWEIAGDVFLSMK